MRLNSRAAPGVRLSLVTGGLITVIGLLVVGIVGMHSLTLHGATPGHGRHEPAAATSATPQAAGHVDGGQAALRLTGTGEPAEAALHSLAAASTGGQLAVGQSQGGSTAHLATLCAVMSLAAAASALLALRLKRLARSTLTHLKLVTRTLTTLRVGRVQTGPPSVWEFSVIRC